MEQSSEVTDRGDGQWPSPFFNGLRNTMSSYLFAAAICSPQKAQNTQKQECRAQRAEISSIFLLCTL